MYTLKNIQCTRKIHQGDGLNVNKSISVPKMVVEKSRVYTWLVIVFGMDVPGQLMSNKEIYQIIKNPNTVLNKQTNEVDKPEEKENLQYYFKAIFSLHPEKSTNEEMNMLML